jgi:hypothetical protein
VNGVAVASRTDVGAANKLQTAGPGQSEEDWRTGWARLETGVAWQPGIVSVGHLRPKQGGHAGIGEQVMRVAD